MLIVIVAQITDNGHAVILYLKKTATERPGETHHIIIETNPFTGKVDTIFHITDLLLYNNSADNIEFNDDREVTMTIIYR
jgi:hypothetical protein